MEDLQLDFDHLYNRRSEPRYRSKPISKRSKQKIVKKRKKKKKVTPKQWDNSLSNLKSYKLSPSKQLEKKLNAVSKHRHYAKDLIQEQKRKHSEQRRLAQEEKDIEQEQKQLIRRKQMLLRKHPMPHFKRTFPVFTAGREHYDDETESDDDDNSHHHEESDPHSMNESEEDDDYEQDIQQPSNEAAMTLKALSSKLSKLEDELEVIRVEKDKNITNEDQEKVEDINEDENVEEENDCDLTLDLESINKTLQAAKEKKSAKPLHIKLPSMPNISQPPQLSESSNISKHQEANIKHQNEDNKINAALHSLDVPSLMMLLDKLKVYFKEIQAEKKQNEEFRSTLLESVNAQNTQILHLLSQLASQQKEMNTLKDEVSTLNAKLSQYETSNMKAIQHKNSEPQWVKHTVNEVENGSNEIALKDIRNIIEESRPNKNVCKGDGNVLKNADWKSISNVLPPKNDTFEYNATPQQPYTVQKHQKKRSFLPSQPTQQRQFIQQAPEEQIRRISAPQPVPKPMKVNSNNNVKYIKVPQNMKVNDSDYSITNYPKVRVERYHQ